METEDRLKKREAWAWVVCLTLAAIIIGQQMVCEKILAHNEMLAKDYQDAVLAENRMLRSRSDFRLPRMGGEELAAISTVARALEWPWELIAAGEKTENGGMRLELGVKQIPSDIRANFPPYLWQRAAAARIMQQEAGKMIMQDPDVTYVFASRLARRWKAANTDEWRNNFITSLNGWRGEGEAVRPSPAPKSKKAGRNKR